MRCSIGSEKGAGGVEGEHKLTAAWSEASLDQAALDFFLRQGRCLSNGAPEDAHDCQCLEDMRRGTTAEHTTSRLVAGASQRRARTRRRSDSYKILTRQLCILYNGLGHGLVSGSALVPPFKEDGSCQRWRGEGKEVRCRRRGEDRRVDGGSEKPWAQGAHRRRACHFTGGEEQKDDYFLLR